MHLRNLVSPNHSATKLVRRVLISPLHSNRNVADKEGSEAWAKEDFFQVYQDGKIEAFELLVTRTVCNMDIQFFPYDHIECPIRINGIGGSEFTSNKRCKASIARAKNDPNKFWVPNNEWYIDGVTTDYSGDTFEITVHATRYVVPIIFYLTIPGILIAICMLLQFALPLDNDGKLANGITCMLSMLVLMTILEDDLAPNQNNVPRLGVFVFSLTIGVMVCTVMCTLVCYLYDKSKKGTAKLPRWLKVLCIWLGRCLLLKETANCLNSKVKLTEEQVELIDKVGIATVVLEIEQEKVNGNYKGKEDNDGNDDIHVKNRVGSEDGVLRSWCWIIVAEILNRTFAVLSWIGFLILCCIYLPPHWPPHYKGGNRS